MAEEESEKLSKDQYKLFNMKNRKTKKISKATGTCGTILKTLIHVLI